MIFASSPTRWEQMYVAPLSQRIGPTPDELVQFLKQNSADNAPPPAAGNVSADFSADVQATIEALPSSVKAHLEQRLLGVFFTEGLATPVATTLVAYANGDLLGAIVFLDAPAFVQASANEWATWRENTAFASVAHTRLNVRIARDDDNTRKAAIQYALLPEFGRVIASGSRFMPNEAESGNSPVNLVVDNFFELSWQVSPIGQIQSRPDQDFALGSSLYKQPILSGEQICSVYEDIGKTSFPTLSAASNAQEDFAESFATYVHSVLLKQPHAVTIEKDGSTIATYEDFWEQPRAANKRHFFECLLAGPVEAFPRQQVHIEAAQMSAQIIKLAGVTYLGLAPFLRLSMESGDLRHIAQELLSRVMQDQNNEFLWMNAATAFFSIGENGSGALLQQQGLEICRQFVIPAFEQPAKCRALMLMAPGDIAENTPLDCLLEFGAVDLILHYVSEEAPLPLHIPNHDVLLVGISESDKNHKLLNTLGPLLENWDRAVINAPQHIPNVERNTASLLLHDAAGLAMPYTYRVSREQVEQAACDSSVVIHTDCTYPVILRPIGSHAGRDLIKAESNADVASYLSTVKDSEFYVSRFIDYSDSDGLFRKFRAALIDGVPYAVHMAISSDWMIHYVNAGMYRDASKRAEEAKFMENFHEFAARHEAAFKAIYERCGLDYVCIDCAETKTGDLLIFEIDHAMIVHDMDPADMFPYKSAHIQKARSAMEQLLFDRAAYARNSTKLPGIE